jgi:acyl-CoA hydrolase
MTVSKKVSETFVRMAQIMTPNDANVLGKVFGGSLLSFIDLTASACATKYAGHVGVTASFDRVDFHEPIEIGELVEAEAHISFVGRTSMEVTIEVYATRLTEGLRRHTNTARVTMVALGEGKPIVVPRLICETKEDKVRFLFGKIRRELRMSRLAELKALMDRLSSSSDGDLDTWLASPDGWKQAGGPELFA